MKFVSMIVLILILAATSAGCGGDGAKGKNSGLDIPRPATGKQG